MKSSGAKLSGALGVMGLAFGVAFSPSALRPLSGPAYQHLNSLSSPSSRLSVRRLRSMPQNLEMNAQAPKKVGIIGAGTAGLSMAHALLTLNTGVESVSVFEQKGETRPGVGGGIQVNGGAAVLAELGLEEEILKATNPTERVLTRKVDGSKILDIDIPQLFRSSPEARKRLVRDGQAFQFSIMRDNLQDLLIRNLPPGTVQYDKKLASLDVGSNTSPAVCKFEDGSSEEFDLVIGADGINSQVRKTIVGPESPIYSGIRIQFGIAPHGPDGLGIRPKSVQNEFHQWFGDGLYAFSASYAGLKGQGYDQLAIIFSDPSPTRENEGWEASELRAEMTERLAEANMPDEMLKAPELAERFFDIGVHFHNPLTPWSQGRAVLVGDAAHAMPPFLGQGANQAIQDALCLSKQLEGLGSRPLEDAVKKFEGIRKPTTTKIILNSIIIGGLETQSGPGALFRDGFFSTLGKVGVAQKVFLDGALPKV